MPLRIAAARPRRRTLGFGAASPRVRLPGARAIDLVEPRGGRPARPRRCRPARPARSGPRRRPPHAVDVAVDPGAHGLPALQRRHGVVGRVQRLVARDVEERDLGPVERIDGPRSTPDSTSPRRCSRSSTSAARVTRSASPSAPRGVPGPRPGGPVPPASRSGAPRRSATAPRGTVIAELGGVERAGSVAAVHASSARAASVGRRRRRGRGSPADSTGPRAGTRGGRLASMAPVSQWMQCPTGTRPVRPSAGAIASHTDVGVSA